MIEWNPWPEHLCGASISKGSKAELCAAPATLFYTFTWKSKPRQTSFHLRCPVHPLNGLIALTREEFIVAQVLSE